MIAEVWIFQIGGLAHPHEPYIQMSIAHTAGVIMISEP